MSRDYLVAIIGGVAGGLIAGMIGSFLPRLFGIEVNPELGVGALALSLLAVGISSVAFVVIGVGLGTYGSLKYLGFEEAGVSAMMAALFTLLLIAALYLLSEALGAFLSEDIFFIILAISPVLGIIIGRKLALAR